MRLLGQIQAKLLFLRKNFERKKSTKMQNKFTLLEAFVLAENVAFV